MAIRKARKNLLRRRELQALDFELRLSIDDISPPIYRDMLLGEGIFLIQLHRAIQSMFGWFDIHEHEFTNDGVRYAEPDEEGRLHLRLEPIRQAMAQSAFAASWKVGEAMPIERAIEYALAYFG